MTMIVVGDPSAGALEACAALGGSGTLVWGGTEPLRDAADRLAELGWDALLVDPADEALATGAMSLLAQTRGHASAVVVHAGPAPDASVAEEAVMVLRHLPVVPVVLVGASADALAAQLEEPMGDLELAPPTVTTVADLLDVCRARAGAPGPNSQATAGLELVED